MVQGKKERKNVMDSRVDFGLGDVKYSCYLVGKPGSGKTTRLIELVQQMTQEKNRIFVLAETEEFAKSLEHTHVHEPSNITPDKLKQAGIHVLTITYNLSSEVLLDRIFLMVVAECIDNYQEPTALVIDGIDPSSTMIHWLREFGKKTKRLNNSLLIAHQIVNEEIAERNWVVKAPFKWVVQSATVND